MVLARAAVVLASVAALAGCSPGEPARSPAVPPPPGAVRLHDGVWDVDYSRAVERLQAELRPTFGRTELVHYRLPSDRIPAGAFDHYDRTLVGWRVDEPLSGVRQGYELRVWSRGHERFAAAHLVPGSDDGRPIVILLTAVSRGF